MATPPSPLGYQNPAVIDHYLDSLPVTYATVPTVRENVQAFVTDDTGHSVGQDWQAIFQQILIELRAIRIGIQTLVSAQEEPNSSTNLIEAAQEYEEEVPV